MGARKRRNQGEREEEGAAGEAEVRAETGRPLIG
jgi:hypothetical protein